MRGAEWLVWHGKASKSVARLKASDGKLKARTLWWNLHQAACYIRDNPGLVDSVRRHQSGLSVSSSIADAAVNQVASSRRPRNGRIRWSSLGNCAKGDAPSTGPAQAIARF